MFDAMTRDVRALANAGLRLQHPGATEREILDAFTRRTLPAALAEAVILERDRRGADR